MALSFAAGRGCQAANETFPKQQCSSAPQEDGSESGVSSSAAYLHLGCIALPHNDVAGFKTYDQQAIALMPAIAQYAKSIHKPLFSEEFGLPQSQGDATYSATTRYNQITTSRAQFFDTIYCMGESLGVAGFAFWNLGCQVNDISFEVGPLTPAVWQTLIKHAPLPPPAARSSAREVGAAR